MHCGRIGDGLGKLAKSMVKHDDATGDVTFEEELFGDSVCF